MDRCALFVDASYVLADGAMAVHGTRRGDSVSWDYEGLLQLLSSLARERSGLPLLRCYWYETSADGRRSADHDALADLPGIKLRVTKLRPGRRDGVESEIQRDLTTLARNNAISDALVLSAEEDLAQVISDVQDQGLRVTLVHITVDGNWTISRALRQEADDLIEVGGEHLRPYVELIAGAEPALDELDTSAARSNGHLAGVGASSYQQSGNHAPPAIYTAPVVAEYQRPALQLPRASAPAEPAAADLPPASTGQAQLRRLPTRAARDQREPREQRDREPRERERDREPREVREPLQVREVREVREAREARESREPWESRDSRDNRESRDSWEPRESREYSPAPTHPAARSAPYSGPQPVMPAGYAAAQQQSVSLSDAVQAAHEEGQDFGESVARDAPALWLEAVLARKPRMPSDLEARLLQGSALPIDFLLHDEVRHALRRGFWDALERTRR